MKFKRSCHNLSSNVFSIYHEIPEILTFILLILILRIINISGEGTNKASCSLPNLSINKNTFHTIFLILDPIFWKNWSTKQILLIK